MNDLITSTFFIVSEFAMVFGIIVIILTIVMIKKWKGSQKNVKDLVTKLKTNEDKRKKKRSATLKQCMKLENKEFDDAVEQVNREEKLFYSKLINIFLGNSKESLSDLDKHVEALIEGCYKPLSNQNLQSVEESDPEKEDLVDTIKQLMDENHSLKKENERIAKELQGLKDETEHVLNEYVSIFNKRDKANSNSS